jgi:hypothetical protein
MGMSGGGSGSGSGAMQLRHSENHPPRGESVANWQTAVPIEPGSAHSQSMMSPMVQGIAPPVAAVPPIGWSIGSGSLTGAAAVPPVGTGSTW